jgi:hypothetical protein
MNLQLKKFDMSTIGDDKVVVLIGKRETGKSFLTKDLLYYHQDIPVGTVVSATEGANQFYSRIVPPIFIHNEYKEETIVKILKRQQKVVEQMNKEIADSGSSNIDARTFLILDDCLYDNSWTKSKYIRSFFMNGRHYKTLFVITMQYALGIPPNLRTNIDYVFILRENIFCNRKRVYDCYAGMFPSFDFFCQVMDQCTENYECLVIHNNAKSNKLEDQVFWYKATPHPDFRMGADIFWKYNQSHSSQENESFDMDQYNGCKKNRTTINVVKREDLL